MRLDDEQESSNFEVQSGGGGGFGGGGGMLGLLLPLIGSRFGCGGIAIVLVILAVTGGLGSLGSMFGGGGGQQAPVEGSRDAGQLTAVQHWSLRVLGSTERTWGSIFAQSGERYTDPVLSFYNRNGMSGCGAAQSAMGPFYCPTDNKVYLDTEFFDELTQRYGAPGDFAQAYVIAHEVGHHVQQITGILPRVAQEQRSADSADANALQVRVELQADCYAGVWGARARDAQGRPLLEPGDIEEGLKAAQAIGDDTLQRGAGRTPVPDSFTHGSSAQRMTWLKRGLESGDPKSCDTFSGAI